MNPTPRVQGGTESLDQQDTAAVLDALEDEDCRSILQETQREARSASELSEACDLPLSTTYRKVDTLTDAGLLEEQIRISTSGKHTSEYTLCVEDIHLTLGADGVELEMKREDSGQSGSLLAGAD